MPVPPPHIVAGAAPILATAVGLRTPVAFAGFHAAGGRRARGNGVAGATGLLLMLAVVVLGLETLLLAVDTVDAEELVPPASPPPSSADGALDAVADADADDDADAAAAAASTNATEGDTGTRLVGREAAIGASSTSM